VADGVSEPLRFLIVVNCPMVWSLSDLGITARVTWSSHKDFELIRGGDREDSHRCGL